MRLAGSTGFGERYQSRETVLKSLNGELHAASDDVSVEVQVEGQVQVFSDAPGERGEGARVRHDVPSSNNGATELCRTDTDNYRNMVHTHPVPSLSK